MASPNYNLIRFIRRCIYQMKREYGGAIQVNILGAVDTNLKTGVKEATWTSYNITRAVVLPVRISRQVIQSISMISANKKFVQGGTFEAGVRTFIIDRRDCSALTAINNEDWIVYNGKRYEIKTIDEFEQNTAWLIVGRELEGAQKNESFPETVSSALAVTDTTTATVGGWEVGAATSSMSLVGAASAVKDIPAPVSSNLGLTVNAAGVSEVGYLLYTSALSGNTFSPSVVMTSGPTVQWDLGDGNFNTNNSVSHTYAGTGNYLVNWDAAANLVEEIDANNDDVTMFNAQEDWAALKLLSVWGNSLTSLDTYAAWTALEQLLVSNNTGLGSLDTRPEWTSLIKIQCGNCGLSTFNTYAAWANADWVDAGTNSLTTFNTYAAWTALTRLYCQNNSSLNSIVAHSAWTGIAYFHCYNCNLSAAVIDAILIALDATGASNGSLVYNGNPGSSDGSRSGAATTAKANLVSKGWVIVIS